MAPGVRLRRRRCDSKAPLSRSMIRLTVPLANFVGLGKSGPAASARITSVDSGATRRDATRIPHLTTTPRVTADTTACLRRGNRQCTGRSGDPGECSTAHRHPVRCCLGCDRRAIAGALAPVPSFLIRVKTLAASGVTKNGRREPGDAHAPLASVRGGVSIDGRQPDRRAVRLFRGVRLARRASRKGEDVTRRSYAGQSLDFPDVDRSSENADAIRHAHQVAHASAVAHARGNANSSTTDARPRRRESRAFAGGRST